MAAKAGVPFRLEIERCWVRSRPNTTLLVPSRPKTYNLQRRLRAGENEMQYWEVASVYTIGNILYRLLK